MLRGTSPMGVPVLSIDAGKLNGARGSYTVALGALTSTSGSSEVGAGPVETGSPRASVVFTSSESTITVIANVHRGFNKHKFSPPRFRRENLILLHLCTKDKFPELLPTFAKGSKPARRQFGECGKPATRLCIARETVDCVLPFQNMSGDSEQDCFADGIVENIIAGLSRPNAGSNPAGSGGAAIKPVQGRERCFDP